MNILPMKNIDREKGQTLIETALVMILLLVLFFGIAEIARAWWLKNQLNNAARVGVRVAIVTEDLTDISPTDCNTFTSADKVGFAACDSITNGLLHDSAEVGLTITDDDGNGTDPGDTVTVTVTGDFESVVPGLAGFYGLFRPGYNMTSRASMRYE
jgi:Flp pilus assembly protein TadG